MRRSYIDRHVEKLLFSPVVTYKECEWPTGSPSATLTSTLGVLSAGFLRRPLGTYPESIIQLPQGISHCHKTNKPPQGQNQAVSNYASPLERTCFPEELGKSTLSTALCPQGKQHHFQTKGNTIILLIFLGGIVVIFWVIFLVFLIFVQFLHLKLVSTWEFPNQKRWFSQLLYCLLWTVKTSRFPQKEHLNSLLHAFLKAS